MWYNFTTRNGVKTVNDRNMAENGRAQGLVALSPLVTV